MRCGMTQKCEGPGSSIFCSHSPEVPAVQATSNPSLLCHLHSNHTVFWQKFNSHDSALPPALQAHSAWTAFHGKLCATPTVSLQPDPHATAPQHSPPVQNLEVPITHDEVEKTLAKPPNGRTIGQGSWPAELLRYAAFSRRWPQIQGVDESTSTDQLLCKNSVTLVGHSVT